MIKMAATCQSVLREATDVRICLTALLPTAEVPSFYSTISSLFFSIRDGEILRLEHFQHFSRLWLRTSARPRLRNICPLWRHLKKRTSDDSGNSSKYLGCLAISANIREHVHEQVQIIVKTLCTLRYSKIHF